MPDNKAYDWFGGSVRSGWKIVRLGSVFRERNEPTTAEDLAPLSVTKNGVVEQQESVAISAVGAPKKVARKGDFVINSRSDRKGSAGIAPRDGSVSLINIVLEPKGIYPQFAKYLLTSVGFQEEFYRFGSGIVADLWTTRYSAMKTIQIPLPPLNEQIRIADELDRELAEIDELIADQQRLQALTEEQYYSQLHQLVTKGVGKSPDLVDSNFDWIGSIPSHWTLQKIGWLFNDIGSGITPSSSDESAFEAGTINWVTTGELRENGISTTKHQINQETLSKYSALKIHPTNSLLIAMYGATIGRLGWLEKPATVNQAVCVLSNPNKVLPKYVYYILMVAKTHLLNQATGGGQPNINQNIIRNLHIPVPPIEEQNKIVKKAEEMYKNIDSLMKETQFLNFLLNQKKRYLIDNLIRFKDRAEKHHSSTFI